MLRDIKEFNLKNNIHHSPRCIVINFKNVFSVIKNKFNSLL